MKKGIFCVKDSKVGFATPFVFPSDAVAIRSFAISVAQAEAHSEIGLYPQDFEFYKIGYFDTDTGIIEPFASPEFVRRAADVRFAIEKERDQSVSEAEDNA